MFRPWYALTMRKHERSCQKSGRSLPLPRLCLATTGRSAPQSEAAGRGFIFPVYRGTSGSCSTHTCLVTRSTTPATFRLCLPIVTSIVKTDSSSVSRSELSKTACHFLFERPWSCALPPSSLRRPRGHARRRSPNSQLANALWISQCSQL